MQVHTQGLLWSFWVLTSSSCRNEVSLHHAFLLATL